MTSDPTAKKAIRNVLTREALINCDFSGDVMDGVDRQMNICVMRIY